jgi:hypothetical protein
LLVFVLVLATLNALLPINAMKLEHAILSLEIALILFQTTPNLALMQTFAQRMILAKKDSAMEFL